MSKVKLGITVGDVNGIGPEVLIKSLSNNMLLNECIPIIYGSSKVIGYHKNIVDEPGFSFININDAGKASSQKINLINCWQDSVNIDLGEATEDGGKCAYIALDRAVTDLNAGAIDALVTAPINKHAMKLAQFPYPGHTEYLAKMSGKPGEELMILTTENLKVAVLSGHIPLLEAAAQVTKDRVISTLITLEQTLKVDFGKEKPTIAVLGLNPHAGDSGEIGTEDRDIIQPAILELKKKGMIVSGPYSADGFFGSSNYRKFDAVLAMYHDQGLIPFKTLSFGSGVNFTAGLPVIRTSPDHGTGYDIAGQNLADASSMRHAIYSAIDIAKNRASYHAMHSSKVEKVMIESAGEIV
jgi:4-phospho-D-threonate 3-dehydrogenase / 4-phospho-D-erythronate 3-dehydrogenase